MRPRTPGNEDRPARRRHRMRRRGHGPHAAGRQETAPHDTAGTRALESVANGSRVRVVRVNGGRRLVHRLATLGLVPGSVVTVVRNRGPAIVSVHGTRMVVGRGAAQAIEWEDVDP